MVSNGVFTLTLNFGTAYFDGSDRWLEIDVRASNPTNSFVTLSPRQPLTAAPYAVRAASASSANSADVALTVASGGVSLSSLAPNTLNASNLTGTLPDSLLSSNIARVSISLLVTNTVVQAQANGRYVLSDSNQVTVQLPTNCNLGDRISVVSTGGAGWKIVQADGQTIRCGTLDSLFWHAQETNRQWTSIACSTYGNRVIACATQSPLLVSSDGGTTWAQRETNRNWRSVASSADGQRLYAAVGPAKMFVSDDGGTNWAQRDSNRGWYAVACSADGMRALAAPTTGNLYVTSDGGSNWVARGVDDSWYTVGVSPSGAQMYAAVSGGALYCSTDYGTTWVVRDSVRVWSTLTAVGESQAAAAVFNGPIYISNDSGATWFPSGAGVKSWAKLSGQPTSSTILASSGNYLHLSRDLGGTWKTLSPISGGSWGAIACSADGTKLFAGNYNSQIYVASTTQTDTTIGTAGYLAGGRSSAIELEYIGNGAFTPVSHEGTITGN